VYKRQTRRYGIGFTLLAMWLAFASGLAPAATSADDDYLVGPGDLLRIAVFGYPDLAGDVRVSQTGNITFPLIGSVPVSGLSARQIETKLSSQLAAGRFIKESQVTVLVTEYQSQRVAVMGEVTNPGQYALQGSRRVLNLLADAGGIVTALSLIHISRFVRLYWIHAVRHEVDGAMGGKFREKLRGWDTDSVEGGGDARQFPLEK